LSLRRIVRPLCFLNYPNEDKKHYRPDGSDYDAADHASRGGNSNEAEKEAAKEGADHTNHEITDEAKATTLDHDASQPTGDEANNEKPDEAHHVLLRLVE
jgi:hypothetical protein